MQSSSNRVMQSLSPPANVPALPARRYSKEYKMLQAKNALRDFFEQVRDIQKDMRKELGLSTKYQVFLSYAWDEENELRFNGLKRLLRTVNQDLGRTGIKVWFDEQNMTGTVVAQMRQGIQDSNLVLLFGTETYRNKTQAGSNANVKKELDFALEKSEQNPGLLKPLLLEGTFEETFSAPGLRGFTQIMVDFTWLNLLEQEYDIQKYIEELTTYRHKVGIIPAALGLPNAAEKYKSRYRMAEQLLQAKLSQIYSVALPDDVKAEEPVREAGINGLAARQGEEKQDEVRLEGASVADVFSPGVFLDHVDFCGKLRKALSNYNKSRENLARIESKAAFRNTDQFRRAHCDLLRRIYQEVIEEIIQKLGTQGTYLFFNNQCDKYNLEVDRCLAKVPDITQFRLSPEDIPEIEEIFIPDDQSYPAILNIVINDFNLHRAKLGYQLKLYDRLDDRELLVKARSFFSALEHFMNEIVSAQNGTFNNTYCDRYNEEVRILRNDAIRYGINFPTMPYITRLPLPAPLPALPLPLVPPLEPMPPHGAPPAAYQAAAQAENLPAANINDAADNAERWSCAETGYSLLGIFGGMIAGGVGGAAVADDLIARPVTGAVIGAIVGGGAGSMSRLTTRSVRRN